MKQTIFLLISALMVLILSQCKKEEDFITSPSASLAFSTDSILFDTVFATIGSTTKQLKVYNPHDQPIKIERIALEGGEASPYRINVDGEYTLSTNDVELDAKDSLFIFVRVRINPDSTPSVEFFTYDKIVFETNNNIQVVTLETPAREANFILPPPDPDSVSAYVGGQVWDNTLPYVIYGYALVESGKTLVINEGAEIFFHANAVLIVDEDATLEVNGVYWDEQRRVTFRGDRLAPEYQGLPGQWGGIWLYKGSKNNKISGAVIRDAVLGLQVDSLTNSGEPTLVLQNTRIENMSIGGIWAKGAQIIAGNVVVANCGQFGVALNGGSYDFRHVTIANYWNSGSRQDPALVLTNYYLTANEEIVITDPTEVYFGNSIIYGNLEEELLTDQYENIGILNYLFDHCLIKTQEGGAVQNFNQCIFNTEPGFVEPYSNDYHLDELANARDKGSIDVINEAWLELGTDLEGRNRTNDTPDVGAYEYFYMPFK